MVLKYMLVEFLIGYLAGLCRKQAVKASATRYSKKVVPAKKYNSIYFGKNLPLYELGFLILKPEFVIVSYARENNIVTSETFFTFLGSSIHINYQNGNPESHYRYAMGTCPIFIGTMIMPFVLGLFLSPLCLVFSPIIDWAFMLFVSGMAWLFLIAMFEIGKAVVRLIR